MNGILLPQGVEGGIFDLDGTILDSLYVWREAGVKYLESLGFAAEENLYEKIFNMSMSQSAEYFIREYGVKKSAQEIIDGVNSLIFDAYKNEVGLLQGRPLEYLRLMKAAGKKITAATTGDRILEEAALKRLGLFETFDRIFYCSEFETSKNESKIFLKCAEYMKVPPERIIVFDDSEEAVNTARKAGFVIGNI